MSAALIALALLGAPAGAEASPAPRDSDRRGALVPDFAKLQTGGFTGLVTVGLGYAAFDDVLNVTLDYGWVPAAYAGRTVHSATTSASVRPFDLRLGSLRWVPLYAGANLMFTFGDGYFVLPPERYAPYSKWYYAPTGAHWLLHLGTELDWLPPSRVFERHGLYLEVRALDTYLRAYARNPRTVELYDVVASTLGYRAAF